MHFVSLASLVSSAIAAKEVRESKRTKSKAQGLLIFAIDTSSTEIMKWLTSLVGCRCENNITLVYTAGFFFLIIYNIISK